MPDNNNDDDDIFVLNEITSVVEKAKKKISNLNNDDKKNLKNENNDPVSQLDKSENSESETPIIDNNEATQDQVIIKNNDHISATFSKNNNTTAHENESVDSTNQHEQHATSPQNQVTPTIIKKVKKITHKSHGGAWKIAYADFVTAMMTFFLLMWLLSMLNKYQLQGISEYFKQPDKKVYETPDAKRDYIYIKNGIPTTDEPLKDKNDSKTKDNKKQKNAQSKDIMDKLKNDLEKNPILSQYKNALNFKVISQGLKIEIKDLENQPMFSNGKTDFSEYAQQIMGWLANLLNTYPNRILVVGHTDSKKFVNDYRYSNWELSADRATATRRALVSSGMDNDKIVRVSGVADTDKIENSDPLASKNRRIVIIVLTDEAYKQLQEQ